MPLFRRFQRRFRTLPTGAAHSGAKRTIPVTLFVAADPSVRSDTARVEKRPTLPVKIGVNLYGGLEVMASEQVSLDAEFGLYVLDENLLNERLFGEAMIRIKVGL